MNSEQWEKFIEENLQRVGKEISPRRELLAEIVKNVPVTKDRLERYANRDMKKTFLGANYWKVFASAGALAVIVAFVVIAQRPLLENSNNLAKVELKTNIAKEALNENQETNNNIINNNLPPTTEEVEAAVVAFIDGLSEEDLDLLEESDSSFLDEEEEVINNFTKIYDDSEI